MARKKIVEKVVKQFQNDDEVIKYIADNFDRTEDLPRLDAEAGYLRPKKSDTIITWSKISTYVRKHAPKRMELTDEEKEIKDTLEKSITKEVINEWGYNEMIRQVEHYYWGQPKAKGLEEKKIMGIGKGITKKQGLTPKQAQFLRVLTGFIHQNGYSPSYEEMKQMNGMKSKSNVHEYIKNLEKRGYLTYEKYCNRTIMLK